MCVCVGGGGGGYTSVSLFLFLTCIADIRSVKDFSECKNCVASFGTVKREIKIVNFFFVYNEVDVGNVFTKTFQKL